MWKAKGDLFKSIMDRIKKWKKFFICFGAVIAVVLLFEIVANRLGFDSIWANDNSFSYEVKNNAVCIKGYEGKKQNLDIPSKINNYEVKEIASGAFSENSSIKKINIPSSVNCIEDKAFSCCTGLVQVNVPEGVKKIGDETFLNCSNLKDVKLPSTLSSIGKNAFLGTAISKINIPDTVSTIGVGAFSNCYSLTSVKIPGSLTNIADDTFSGCSNLKDVTISGSVASIGEKAFAKCDALSKIEIPDSVGTINAYAFNNCSNLSSVTIGRNVKQIGDNAFNNCTSLGKVLFLGNGINNVGDGTFSHVKENGVIIVPTGKIETYSNVVKEGKNLMKTIKFVEGSSLDAFSDSKQTSKNDLNTNDTKVEKKEENKEDKKEDNKEDNKVNEDPKGEIDQDKKEDNKDDNKEVIEKEENKKETTDDNIKKDAIKEESKEETSKDSKIETKSTCYKDDKKCLVKFINGDDTVKSIDVGKGEKIDLIEEPKGNGKDTFVGWETKKNSKRILCMENSSYEIQEDMEFKAVWIDFQMLTGASIKLSKPTGIRFSSRISTESYNNIKELSQSISFGTVICPTDYLDDINCFTTQKLSEKNKGYLDIPLKVWFDENDDFKEFTGVITNVKEKNYDRDFSARSYISIKYSNGSECRFYSAFDKKNNSRSISRVANAAVKDEESYTKEQIDILKKFLEISKLGD